MRQDGGPPPGEPLVLWQPPEDEGGLAVDVDPMLCRCRNHACLTAWSLPQAPRGCGCVLAAVRADRPQPVRD